MDRAGICRTSTLVMTTIAAFQLSYPAMAEEGSGMTSLIFMSRHDGEVVRDVERFEKRYTSYVEWSDWLPTEILTEEQRAAPFDGKTHLLLTVNDDGRVSECEIVQSDLSAVQNDRVCTSLVNLARFEKRYLQPATPLGWKANFTVEWRTIPTQRIANVPPPVAPPPLPYEQWPRRVEMSGLVIEAFPKLGDLLPRHVKATGRTSLELVVNAKSGVTACRIGISSGQPVLDDLACNAAAGLSLRYTQFRDEYFESRLPLQFEWAGKSSHIRIPLPSTVDTVPRRFDPLDRRKLRTLPTDTVRMISRDKPRENFPDVPNRWGAEFEIWLQYRIGETGAVTECKQISSVHPIYEAAACNLLRRRWTFNPARDVFGDPIFYFKTDRFVMSRAGLDYARQQR